MSVSFDRARFMSASHKSAIGNMPRTHQNCLSKTGVCRPGKTEQARARRVTKP